MTIRTLIILSAIFVVAGCEQAPFQQRHAVACDKDHQPAHASIAQDGFIVGCNSRSGEGTVHAFKVTPEGSLDEVARATFGERVTAVAPWPGNDGGSGLLVALGGNHERQIMHLTRNSDGFSDPVVVHQTRFEVARMIPSDVNEDGISDVVMPELDTAVVNEGTEAAPEFNRRQSLDRSARVKRVLGNVVDVNANGRENGTYIRESDGVVRLYSTQGQQEIVLQEDIERVGAVLGGGDVNGDGKPDLVVSAKGMPDEKVVMLALSGDDEWTLSEPVAGLVNPATVLVRDFDGDGNLDLLAAPKATGGKNEYSLEFLPGRGGAEFGKPLSISVKGFPYRMIGGPTDNPAADAFFLDENGRLGLLTVTP